MIATVGNRCVKDVPSPISTIHPPEFAPTPTISVTAANGRTIYFLMQNPRFCMYSTEFPVSADSAVASAR
jgi:hypothetical protein